MNSKIPAPSRHGLGMSGRHEDEHEHEHESRPQLKSVI
jgi:hypothetical protein